MAGRVIALRKRTDRLRFGEDQANLPCGTKPLGKFLGKYLPPYVATRLVGRL